jgi:hypothetical protein
MGLFTNEGLKLKKLCHWASFDWQSIETVHVERGSLKKRCEVLFPAVCLAVLEVAFQT